ARAAVQVREESLVAVALALPLGVGEDRIRVMQRGQRRSRMPLPDLAQVAVEQRLLQRLSSDQVIGERKHLAVDQDLVVAGDDRLEFLLGARSWIMPEQRVQDGHEVALA